MTKGYKFLRTLYATVTHLGVLKVTQRCFLKLESTFKTKEFPEINIKIRSLKESDIPIISEKLNKDIRSEIDYCAGGVVATAGDTLVHWSLLSYTFYYHADLDAELCFSPNSAFIHNLYTIPAYRNKNITSTVLVAICQHLITIGKTEILITVFKKNYPSLNAAYKAGFRKFGTISYFQLFLIRLYFIEGNCENDYKILRRIFLANKGVTLSLGNKRCILLRWD